LILFLTVPMKKYIASIAAIAALLSMTPAMVAAEDAAPKKGGLAAADANGDGKLNLAEYTQMVSKRMDAGKAKARFAELDKDGNGSLTREELNAGRKQEGGEKKAEATGKKAEAAGKKAEATGKKAEAAGKKAEAAGKKADKESKKSPD